MLNEPEKGADESVAPYSFHYAVLRFYPLLFLVQFLFWGIQMSVTCHVSISCEDEDKNENVEYVPQNVDE